MQNTYIPDDMSQWQPVDSTVPLEQPFNPNRVAELVNQKFVVGPGGVVYLGAGPTDTLVEVYLPITAAQDEIDAAIARLNEICVDPTRNNLTDAEVEAAAVAAERTRINSKIDQAAADKDSINLAGAGLRDRITGSSDLGVLGINDVLKNNVFNAPGVTNAQKIETLRVELLELADITKSLLNIVASELQTEIYLLREKRQDLLGK